MKETPKVSIKLLKAKPRGGKEWLRNDPARDKNPGQGVQHFIRKCIPGTESAWTFQVQSQPNTAITRDTRKQQGGKKDIFQAHQTPQKGKPIGGQKRCCAKADAQPLKKQGTISKAKKKGKVNSPRHRYQAILNNPENKVDLMQRSSWEERRVTGKGVPSRPIYQTSVNSWVTMQNRIARAQISNASPAITDATPPPKPH